MTLSALRSAKCSGDVYKRQGKGCVFGGVVNEAIEKAKTADAFVFGTPVHYASASGNMTSFMDRLAYAGGKYLAYKPAAICASARRAGTRSEEHTSELQSHSETRMPSSA